MVCKGTGKCFQLSVLKIEKCFCIIGSCLLLTTVFFREIVKRLPLSYYKLTNISLYFSLMKQTTVGAEASSASLLPGDLDLL